MKFDQRAAKIELILSDVDGVLTDGGITFDNQGIEYKQFHVRDGLGIKLWQRAGGTFGLLTARSSHIVRVRAAELGIDLIRQGFDDKLAVAQQILEQLRLTPDKVCYVGDDLADLPLMQYVGLGVAVANAASDVLAIAHHTTAAGGGHGAVRELVESILKSQGRWDEVIRRYKTT
jgi:YrbI family 3-deoxy-D-manno-octulosonate 8-phosphate phosphatase